MELKIINKERVYNILHNNHKVIIGIRIILIIQCFINKTFSFNHSEIKEIHKLQFKHYLRSEDSVIINLEGSLNITRWYIDHITKNVHNKQLLNTENKIILHDTVGIKNFCYISEGILGTTDKQNVLYMYMKEYYNVLYTLFKKNPGEPENTLQSISNNHEIISLRSKYIYKTLAHLFLMTEGLYIPIQVNDSEYDDMVCISLNNNKYIHIQCITSYIEHKRMRVHMDISSVDSIMYNCYCNMSESDKSEREMRIIEFFIKYSDVSVIQDIFKYTEPTTRDQFITGEFMNTPGFLIQNYVYRTMHSVIEIKLFIKEVHALLMECIKGVSVDKLNHKETAIKIFKKLFITKEQQKKESSVLLSKNDVYNLIEANYITKEISGFMIDTNIITKYKNIFIEIQEKVNSINAVSLWGLMYSDYLLFLLGSYMQSSIFTDLSKVEIKSRPCNGGDYINFIEEEYYNGISGIVLFKHALGIDKNHKRLISALLAISIYKDVCADSCILKFIESLVLFTINDKKLVWSSYQDILDKGFPIKVNNLPIQHIALEFIKKKRLLADIPHTPIIRIDMQISILSPIYYSDDWQILEGVLEYFICKESTEGLCYFISICMSNLGHDWLSSIQNPKKHTISSISGSSTNGNTHDLTMYFTAGGTDVVRLTRIYDNAFKTKNNSDKLQFEPNNVSGFLTYILYSAIEDISMYKNIIEKTYEIWIRTMLNEELKPVIQSIVQNSSLLKSILGLLEEAINKLSENRKNAACIAGLYKMQEDIQAIICNIEEYDYEIYTIRTVWEMPMKKADQIQPKNRKDWIWNGMDVDEKMRIFDSGKACDETKDNTNRKRNIKRDDDGCSFEESIKRSYFNSSNDQSYNSDSSSYFASTISSLSDIGDVIISGGSSSGDSDSINTSYISNDRSDSKDSTNSDCSEYDFIIINTTPNYNCGRSSSSSGSSKSGSDSKKTDDIKHNPISYGNNSKHDISIAGININRNRINSSSDSDSNQNVIVHSDCGNNINCGAIIRVNRSGSESSDSSHNIIVGGGRDNIPSNSNNIDHNLSSNNTDSDTDSSDSNPIMCNGHVNNITCSADIHANNSTSDSDSSDSNSNSGSDSDSDSY
ncbi:hypothetical protein NEIG_02161 [Nematocida sp. ERTm5]|nr:hypothetical protein NEIG_02161 [Nematocida sp. ERTm5]